MTTSLTQHICVCINYMTHQSIPLNTQGKKVKGKGVNQDIRDFSLHNIDISYTRYGKIWSQINNQDIIQIKLVLLPIQDSTTSVFQINCRNAELSSNLALRLSAVVARSWIFFCRVSIRWAMASPLWLPYNKKAKSMCFCDFLSFWNWFFIIEVLKWCPKGQMRLINR